MRKPAEIMVAPASDINYRTLAHELVDLVIASLSPVAGVKRQRARRVLAAYEAAKPTILRKQSRDSGSGNSWVSQAGPNLRNQARFLDANHDLAKEFWVHNT